MRKSIQHLASNHMASLWFVAAGQPLETVLMWWPRSPASICFLLRRHRRATAEKPGQRVCDQPVSEGSRNRAPCTSNHLLHHPSTKKTHIEGLVSVWSV
jgi:hypothetical protein